MENLKQQIRKFGTAGLLSLAGIACSNPNAPDAAEIIFNNPRHGQIFSDNTKMIDIEVTTPSNDAFCEYGVSPPGPPGLFGSFDFQIDYTRMKPMGDPNSYRRLHTAKDVLVEGHSGYRLGVRCKDSNGNTVGKQSDGGIVISNVNDVVHIRFRTDGQ